MFKLNDATNKVFKDFFAACRRKMPIEGKACRVYDNVALAVYDGNGFATIGGDAARFQ